MNETADAVVVGAGLNGAATAYFLLRKGLKRVVICESDRPAGGASGAAVGLLRTHYDNFPEAALAVRSMPYFRNWPDMIGGSCEWRQTGFVRFVEPEEVDKMQANLQIQLSLGENVRFLAPDDLRAIYPSFNTEDIGGAVYEPESGTSSNSQSTYSLLKQATSIGAELKAYTPALSIRTDNGRVDGVNIPGGAISSPVVVLAAGTGSRELSDSCGVTLPLEARNIWVGEIFPEDGFVYPAAYMDPLSDSWLSPRSQGHALISVPNEKARTPVDPSRYDARVDPQRIPLGLDRVAHRLPAVRQSLVIGAWARPDAYAPDGKPLIGAVAGLEGLFMNTASAGKGHKTAPAAALALAELVVDGSSSTVDLTPFGLDRFNGQEHQWSTTEYRKRSIG